MSTIRVAVVDDHEIFRRGLVACLQDEPLINVLFAGASGPVSVDIDVAIVSHEAALAEQLACPLVVCSGDARHWARAYEEAMSQVLPAQHAQR